MTLRRRNTSGDCQSEAVYSTCLRYRYTLTRTWDGDGPRLLWVMLNPSTATERLNDPTIERCERRTRALGYGAMRIVNLFAWRATRPADLRAAADPEGPANARALTAGARWADAALCAWGTHGARGGAGAAAIGRLAATGTPLLTLGLTKDGHPRHPLYVAYAEAPRPWHPDQKRAFQTASDPLYARIRAATQAAGPPRALLDDIPACAMTL